MGKKLASWSAAALLVFYALTNPTEAAGVLRQVFTGVGAFGSALTGGGQ